MEDSVFTSIPVETKDRVVLRAIINTAYIHYVTYSKMPTVKEIVAKTPYSELQVETAIESEEFAQAMASRGLPWRRDPGFNTEQSLVLMLLTNPTDRRTLEQKLKSVKVTYAKYRAWMRDPKFSSALQELSNQMLMDNMSAVDSALVQQASKGNMNAIEFFYKMTGRYDSTKQSTMDVLGVMNRMVEIISTHVKDPDVLDSIGNDIQALAQDAGLIQHTAVSTQAVATRAVTTQAIEGEFA